MGSSQTSPKHGGEAKFRCAKGPVQETLGSANQLSRSRSLEVATRWTVEYHGTLKETWWAFRLRKKNIFSPPSLPHRHFPGALPPPAPPPRNTPPPRTTCCIAWALWPTWTTYASPTGDTSANELPHARHASSWHQTIHGRHGLIGSMWR